MKTKIVEVVYSMSTKINLGNYESADVLLSAKAPVDKGDDPETVYEDLRDWVKDHVREERRVIIEANNAKKKPYLGKDSG